MREFEAGVPYPAVPAFEFPWSRVFGRVNLPAKKHEIDLKGQTRAMATASRRRRKSGSDPD
jgi:hypothetical protein